MANADGTTLELCASGPADELVAGKLVRDEQQVQSLHFNFAIRAHILNSARPLLLHYLIKQV